MKTTKLLKLLTAIIAACLLLTAFTACTNTAATSLHLTFVVDGETYHEAETQREEAITLPSNPAKVGYVFDGWYLDDGFTTPFDETAIDAAAESVTIYGKWKVCEHQMTSTAAKAATCEEIGWDAYESCSVCAYATYVEIPALGHDYGEAWASDDTAHYHACIREGCTAKSDETAHADEDKDHACDTCKKVVSTCADEDKDHACDVCGASMGVHQAGEDGTTCDYCGESLIDCVDENKDHKCDTCEKVISTCVDENNDHACDVCEKTVSTCADEDKDHKCDVCGTKLSDHTYVDSICSVCGDFNGVMEAETYAWLNSCGTENSASSSGGSNVNNFWSYTKSSIVFHFTATKAGTVTLTFRIANVTQLKSGLNPSWDMSEYNVLSFNGEHTVLNGTLQPMNGWFNYCSLTATVEAKVGSNEVHLYAEKMASAVNSLASGYDNENWCLNIDYLKVETSDSENVLVPEAAANATHAIPDVVLHEHTYATDWTYDEDNHWHAATCDHSELKKDVTAHSWVAGAEADGYTVFNCVCGATKRVASRSITTRLEAENCATALNLSREYNVGTGTAVVNWQNRSDDAANTLTFYFTSNYDDDNVALTISAANQQDKIPTTVEIDLANYTFLYVNGTSYTVNGKLAAWNENWHNYQNYTATIAIKKGLNEIQLKYDNSWTNKYSDSDIRLAFDYIELTTYAINAGTVYQAEDTTDKNCSHDLWNSAASGVNSNGNRGWEMDTADNYIVWDVNSDAEREATVVLYLASRRDPNDCAGEKYFDTNLANQEIFYLVDDEGNKTLIPLEGTLIEGVWLNFTAIKATVTLKAGVNHLRLQTESAEGEIVRMQVDCIVVY